MKNLENYGVQEMDAEEMKTTEGGNPFVFLALFIIVVYELAFVS